MPTYQKTCVGNQKTKKPRNCIVCNREFLPKTSKHKTCSVECREIHKKEHYKRYKKERSEASFKHGIVWVLVEDPTSEDGYKWVKEVRP